jgi:glucoamylase
MYFGRSAGSAQPLVWAHAEYLKLLHSVADNKIFDRISVVHERYDLDRGNHSFRRHLGIFQLNRPTSAAVQGGTLRIMDATRFTVVYTTDNWATKIDLEARVIGHLGAFADIPIASDQTGSIIFTLHWPEEDRWLGRNYEVTVHAETPTQGTAAEKPKF